MKKLIQFRIVLAVLVASLFGLCSTNSLLAAPAGVGQMFRLDGGGVLMFLG